MPYTNEIIGIYAIINEQSSMVYIGQSRRMKKRVADHFNLLNRGIHPNQKLQRSWNKYGSHAFRSEIVAECEVGALDEVEEAFLKGEGSIDEMPMFNIAIAPTSGMTGRHHSVESRKKMSETRRARPMEWTPELRQKLSDGQRRRNNERPGYIEVVKETIRLVEEGFSYTETARRTSTDTSTARKRYLKYRNKFNG